MAGTIALVVGVVGLLVLAGWTFDIEMFTRLHPALPAMKANSAVAFACAATALWAVRVEDRRTTRWSRCFAATTLVIGAVTLVQHVTGWNLHIDQLLVSDDTVASTPGRMSALTASAFVCVGSGLLAIDVETRSGWRPAQWLALTTATLGLVAIVGHLYGARPLHAMGGAVAVHAGVSLFVIGVGILYARPTRGIMRVITSRGTTSSGLLRTLLPFMVLLPIVFGWLRLLGERTGLYSFEVGLAIFALANAIGMTALMWSVSFMQLRLEHQRRAGSEDFRNLAEALPQMVWTCVKSGACDYLSPQWVEYTGISADEQLGERWLAQLHPDDVATTRYAWTEAVERSGSLDTEFRIRRHDGQYRWFKTRGVAVRDATGEIAKWIGSNTDIQDLRDAQDATLQVNRQLEERVLMRTEELRSTNVRLEHTTSQLVAAQRITQVGSWQLDVATGAVTWSAELFRIMRMPKGGGAPSFRDQAGLFTPDSWARLTAAVNETTVTGKGYELTLTVIRADGTECLAIARAEALRGATGTVETLVGTLQDVTEREHLNRELSVLHERLRLATTAAQMGVWEWSIASNALVWDDAMYRLYGLTAERFPGAYEAWSSAIHPDDRATAEGELAAAVTGPSEFNTTFRITHADGNILHIRAAALTERDSDGRAVRMVGVNWDITAQRIAELTLQRTETLQRTILEYAGPAIIATDVSGTITLFNPAAESLLGYKASDVVGTATPAIIHEAEEIEARRILLEAELGVAVPSPFETLVSKSRSHGPDAVEWTYVRKDGVRVPVLVTVTAIRDEGATVVGYLGVAVNLTPQKQAKRELLEVNKLLAERSAQREVLLQEVHHRVKNNLQVIASLVNMQLRQVTDVPASDALKEMRTRIQAIALIHEQLYQGENYTSVSFSAYAKALTANIFQTTDIRQNAVSLESSFDEIHLGVEKAVPCGLILNELIINALKHAFPDERRGTIRVSFVMVTADLARLTVADDGCGIPPHVEAGKTSSLGMRLVGTLTRQLEGHVQIDRSKPGTAVHVTFPMRDVEGPRGAAQPAGWRS